jgi:hypothetical protein
VVQVLVGALLDRLVLPPRQHNNIAPRLVKRLFQKQGKRPHAVRDWSLGTVFHFGYGIGWGAVFGLVQRWSGLPAPLLGLGMGGLLYLLAFSRIGVGTKTDTEQQPERRSWRKQLSLVAVAWGYALATTGIYSLLEDRRRD